MNALFFILIQHINRNPVVVFDTSAHLHKDTAKKPDTNTNSIQPTPLALILPKPLKGFNGQQK